ncbi:MAG: 4-hydroxy-tetrahydrodipicolinate synthase [Bacteriovoracaceae bacterium]|nr:4-hydroxy-tetrahydrodipicolinate synthase [Bacteriovoracaceae bacterium]
MNLENTILWTAVVTPFSKDGKSIDYTSVENICRMQSEAGNGIVLAGSTGEGLSLSRLERQSLVKFVLGLKLNTPIMAGVPSYNFDEAMEWMDFCKEVNLSAHLMTTPMYTKPGLSGQTEWFEALLNKSHAPAMLYNIPSRTGVKLFPETIKNLNGQKHLWAIKDSSGQVESVVDFLETGVNIKVFCGDDYLMPAMAAEGACGLVSVLSNPWPKQTHAYVKNCLEGVPLKNKIWWRATKAMFSASNPVPAKSLMKQLGIIANANVRLPLSLNDLKSMEALNLSHAEMSKGQL